LILLLENLAIKEKVIFEQRLGFLIMGEAFYHEYFLYFFIQLVEKLKVDNTPFEVEEVLTKLKTYEFSAYSFSYDLLIAMLEKREPELIESCYEYLWIMFLFI
jgi:hypothetical protein